MVKHGYNSNKPQGIGIGFEESTYCGSTRRRIKLAAKFPPLKIANISFEHEDGFIYAESPQTTILIASFLVPSGFFQPCKPIHLPFDWTILVYASKHSSIANGYGCSGAFPTQNKKFKKRFSDYYHS